jgi:RNA polymerase sigma-70 factor (ECF subfamily)
VHEADRIRRARQGDEQAWTSLVREHQTAAFRLAYLLLGSAEDAEDVAQEVFIRAFRALDRFDLERPFRPWLLGYHEQPGQQPAVQLAPLPGCPGAPGS